MKRCSCTACLLKAALELLNTGRAGMATLLVEQALEQAEQQKTKRVTRSARRGSRRARP